MPWKVPAGALGGPGYPLGLSGKLLGDHLGSLEESEGSKRGSLEGL